MKIETAISLFALLSVIVVPILSFSMLMLKIHKDNKIREEELNKEAMKQENHPSIQQGTEASFVQKKGRYKNTPPIAPPLDVPTILPAEWKKRDKNNGC